MVFAEGDAGDCAYLVEEGSVTISVEREGRDVELAKRVSGEIIGEMALIDGLPRSASAVASEPCRMTVITSSQLSRRLAQLDPVLRMCMVTILRRFRTTLETKLGSSAPEENEDETPATSESAIAALRLERDIANAIDTGEFELHLQPIVALAGQRIAGFECLVRWRHPERGLLSPQAFIGVAEDSGLIVELTRWVINEVCRLANRFNNVLASGMEPLFFTINLSGRDLAEPDFVERLERKLTTHQVDGRTLKLEITESVLMADPERVAQVLGQCRELGLAVAIDDFGTGYSSFDYLHRFPIDCLKIDRCFVASLQEDSRSRAIVGSMINLADSLGIPVVAEGIEEIGQADVLEALGCTFAQGYLYSRPVPVEAAADLLAAGQASGDPTGKLRLTA